MASPCIYLTLSQILQLFGSLEAGLDGVTRSGSVMDLNAQLTTTSQNNLDKSKHRYSLPGPSERPFGLCEYMHTLFLFQSFLPVIFSSRHFFSCTMLLINIVGQRVLGLTFACGGFLLFVLLVFRNSKTVISFIKIMHKKSSYAHLILKGIKHSKVIY